MNIFNNDWVVGIGASLVSSVIFYLATRYFSDKQVDELYQQNIKAASREVLQAAKSLLAEKHCLDGEALVAIKLSIASKYEVNEWELYRDDALANDLICEVMSSAFLTAEQKNEYYLLLVGLKKNGSNNALCQEQNRPPASPLDKTSRQLLSAVVAVLSFIQTIAFLSLAYPKSGSLSSGDSAGGDMHSHYIYIALAALLGVILVCLLYVRMGRTCHKGKTDTKRTE